MTTKPLPAEYRPSNVRIVPASEVEGLWLSSSIRWVVLDFDGTPMQGFASYEDAEARRRNRAGVIRAAITRRANKARKDAR
jgi:hypothetical protein